MTAEELDRILTKEISTQEKAIDAIEVLILSAWNELKPTVEVLKKHGIPFKNPRVGHETPCGLLVGKTEANAPRLAVLEADRVFYVEPGCDKMDAEESVPLKKFIRNANLLDIKTGIAFARNVKRNVVEHEEAYTQRLSAFLRDNPVL